MSVSSLIKADWNPCSHEVRQNQVAAYDKMRRTQPVAYSEFFGWTIFRHADVLDALLSPETFSNVVSKRMAVPNGMDAPTHTPFRKLIDPYFTPAVLAKFEPRCREAVRKIISTIPRNETTEFTSHISLPFAVAAQAAFLGWPDSLHPVISSWIRENQRAISEQNRPDLNRLGHEFTDIIAKLIAEREDLPASHDLTASLVHKQVMGRALSHDEITSILRTWTAGEIGTISASASIIAHFLACRPDIRELLREQPDLIDTAVDEILRIHGPLVMSRRRTTRDVEVSGRVIPADQPVTLNWISANRDEARFPNPDEFRLDRDPAHNLLYGAGIHVCPGAPLARMELRIFTQELLTYNDSWLIPSDSPAPVYDFFPSSGYATLPLRFSYS